MKIASRRRTPARRSALAAALLAVFTMLVTTAALTPGPAYAQPPLRMGDQVIDTAGVFSATDHDRIEHAIDELSESRDIQMWVVYVDDFAGKSPEAWTRETVSLSEFGSRDVILAVATGKRADDPAAKGPISYRLFAPDSIDGLTSDELASIGSGTLQPALDRGKWADSAIDTIEAVDDSATDSSHTLAIVGGVAALLVVIGAGIYLFARRRGRPGDDVDALADSDDPLTVDQLSEEPLDVLHAWSREVLNDTDNAVRASVDELTLAVDELGEGATAPFAAALAAAQQTLASSFAVRQRLDETEGLSDDDQRTALVQIITTCSHADALLDEQVAAFDGMRNLLRDAPERLAQLTARITETTDRFDDATATLEDLTARHGGTVVASIAGNIDLARKQVQFAEDSVDQGRDAVAQPEGKQGPVVADIRSAEGALDTANKLLDAIESADEKIERARAGLPSLIEAVRAEIAAAATVESDDALTAATEKAASALDAAEADGDTDPLRAFADLSDADADLGAVMVDRAAARATELLTNALETAEAKTQAAADFIDTRRGAVGSVARTRLSRAQRLGGEAVDASSSAPSEALTKARQAARSADEALAQAEADVAEWHARSAPRAGDDSDAVLAGILVDSFVRTAARDGSTGPGAGGYTTGGRSPASYGGSSSSGRIGTGGRF